MCNFYKQKCKFQRVLCKLCVSYDSHEPQENSQLCANHLIYCLLLLVVFTVILLLLYRYINLFSIFIKILLLSAITVKEQQCSILLLYSYTYSLPSCYVRGNNIYFIQVTFLMSVCYYVCMSTVFYGVYCYMKLQGYLRLFNVTRIDYTMILLSLLTDSLTQFYSYATVVYSDDTATTLWSITVI